jgi:prenylcysteine alpha-carboxyl methylesterase
MSVQSRLEELSSEPVDGEVPKLVRSMSGDFPDVMGRCISEARHADESGSSALARAVLRRFPVVSDLASFFVYCVDLTFRSIPWFRFWCKTLRLGVRTIVWTNMMLPPLIRYAAKYFRDRRVCKRVAFGRTPREYLDIYVPQEASLAQQGEGPKVPVVVAMMGGGFVIGHRSYNVQLGLRCVDAGIMLVCIDYRNFPFAQIPDMVENVSRGVRWVFQNIASFGGDVDNMLFAGQSAGAHLGASALLHHCLLEAKHIRGAAGPEKKFDIWSVKQFKAFVGVSGPYDIAAMAPHFGLPPRMVDSLTMGDNLLSSPGLLVSSEEWKQVAECATALLPPIRLFHGDNDMLVPSSSSVAFAEQLHAAGVQCTLDVRRGVNHTYPVIEGPILCHDIQLEIFLPILLGEGWQARLKASARRKPLWPPAVVRLASWLSPFGSLGRGIV